MTRGIAYAILIAFGTLALVLVAARPDWAGDQNKFLRDFVNHEFINVLGITLAVTLASAAQIHLAFNRTEEAFRAPNGLRRARIELTRAVYWLISLFVAGVAVVAIKPIASTGSPTGEAFFNMAALFVLLWHVLLMISLTQLVFSIEPVILEEAPKAGVEEEEDRKRKKD